MTWKEVKEQIEAGGVTDDMEMWFIDISFGGDLNVSPQDEDEERPNTIGFSVTN
ncbi:MAG: hypothetical protein AAF571_10340 [Verrucomicrobiota bacterium]